MTWLCFLGGFMVGGIAGVFCMALLFMASRPEHY